MKHKITYSLDEEEEMVSLTTDAWSLEASVRYTVVAPHRVESRGNIRTAVLKFGRFLTSHTVCQSSLNFYYCFCFI